MNPGMGKRTIKGAFHGASLGTVINNAHGVYWTSAIILKCIFIAEIF